MIRRIFLSGATGYIGGHILDRLLANPSYQVFILTQQSSCSLQHKNIQGSFIFDGSYASIQVAMQEARPDVVIHCAALALYEEKDMIEPFVQVNFALVVYLLQAMTEVGCNKIINTGSYWQHGETINEGPNCLYATLKECAETTIDYYVKRQGMSAITLRLMDVYGPHDPRPKLLPYLLQRLESEEEFGVTFGEQYVNLIYIDDVVNAYIQTLSLLNNKSYKDEHKIYYVASANLIPLKEVIQNLLLLSQSRLKIKWGEKPYRPTEIMRPFIGEILPNWQAKVDIINGMKQMLEQGIK